MYHAYGLYGFMYAFNSVYRVDKFVSVLQYTECNARY